MKISTFTTVGLIQAPVRIDHTSGPGQQVGTPGVARREPRSAWSGARGCFESPKHLPRVDPGVWGGSWEHYRGVQQWLFTNLRKVLGFLTWRDHHAVYQLKGCPPFSPGVSVLAQGQESLEILFVAY